MKSIQVKGMIGMYCPYCGMELEDDETFCPNCLTPVFPKKRAPREEPSVSGFGVVFFVLVLLVLLGVAAVVVWYLCF